MIRIESFKAKLDPFSVGSFDQENNLIFLSPKALWVLFHRGYEM
jgi:hypothetical protein